MSKSVLSVVLDVSNPDFIDDIKHFYLTLIANTIVHRPSSIINSFLMGTKNTNNQMHDSNQDEEGYSGYENISFVSEFCKPHGGLLEQTCLDDDTSKFGGDPDIIASIVVSLKHLRCSEVLTLKNEPRKTFHSREIYLCGTQDTFNALRAQEADPTMESFIEGELSDLNAQVIIVVPAVSQPPEGAEGILGNLVKVTKRVHLRSYSAMSKQLKTETKFFPFHEGKVNPKVRYTISFEQAAFHIGVESYIMARPETLPSSKMLTEEDEKVVVTPIYTNVDSQQAVRSEDLGKAFRIGDYLVRVSAADEESLRSDASKGIKVLGLARRENVPFHMSKGSSELVVPTDSQDDGVSFRGMVKHLFKKNKVMIGFNAFRDGVHETLVVLLPCLVKDGLLEFPEIHEPQEEDRYALVMNYLPFREDIRINYPSKLPGMKIASEREKYCIASMDQELALAALMKENTVQNFNTISDPVLTRFNESLVDCLTAEKDEMSALPISIDDLLCSKQVDNGENNTNEQFLKNIKMENIKQEFNFEVPLNMREKELLAQELQNTKDLEIRQKIDITKLDLDGNASVKVEEVVAKAPEMPFREPSLDDEMEEPDLDFF